MQARALHYPAALSKTDLLSQTHCSVLQPDQDVLVFYAREVASVRTIVEELILAELKTMCE
jgi:hypothetical protein